MLLIIENTNLLYHFPSTSASSADIGKKLSAVKTLVFLNNDPSDSHIANKMGFIKELWMFLRSRKKLWLAPIIIVMVILGGLLILAQGSVVAPFIYTIF